MGSEIGEIDPSKPSGAGEALAAAYAAALARAQNNVIPETSRPTGGGSQTIPDAVHLVGQRRDDRAAQIREQSERLKSDAARTRQQSHDTVAKGERDRAGANQAVARQEQKLFAAHDNQTSVRHVANRASTPQIDAARANVEALVHETQAVQAERAAEHQASLGEELIVIGAGNRSKTTVDEGAQMVRTAGSLLGQSKILYTQSRGTRATADGARARSATIRAETADAVSSARLGVSDAESTVAAARAQVDSANARIDAGNALYFDALDLDTHALVLSNRAEIVAQASSIPFYVSQMAV